MQKVRIVFCDKRSWRCLGDMVQELAHHEILLTAHRPHLSEIFEVLNRLLFDRLKSEKKYLRREGEPDSLVDQKIRDFRVDEIAATTSTTRRRCNLWPAAGSPTV
jgi:hypothetical protein